MEGREILDRNREGLLKDITVTDFLWQKLIEHDVVSHRDMVYFKETFSDRKKIVSNILRIVRDNIATKYERFRTALKASRREGIVKKYLPPLAENEMETNQEAVESDMEDDSSTSSKGLTSSFSESDGSEVMSHDNSRDSIIKAINRNLSFCIKHLNPKIDDIFDKMVDHGLISKEYVYQLKGRYAEVKDRTKALLRIIRTKPLKDLELIMGVLMVTGEWVVVHRILGIQGPAQLPSKRKAEAEVTKDVKKQRIDYILSRNRGNAINLHFHNLKQKIDLESSNILNILREKATISVEEEQSLEENDENSQKVEQLLNMLTRKSNTDFKIFCETLCQNGHEAVVREYLITQDDLDDASYTLENLLKDHYTDIELYTTEGKLFPVPIRKLFVEMQWDLPGSCENKTDMNQYLTQVIKGDHTRFVVTGDPGIGKTTFVKKVCEMWAVVPYESKCDHIFSKYKLVIPIILRYLRKENNTLFSILRSQFPALSFTEIIAILKRIDTRPDTVMFLFDGYDELVHHEVINSIMQGEIYRNVKVIITTRQHGVSWLRKLSSKAVERAAGILGFHPEQAKEYIRLFFQMRRDPEKGERLISFLKNKRILKSLTRIPIRLEMMCIIWDEKEDLGETLSELYYNFLYQMFDRFARKHQKNITDESIKEFAMKIGSLANTFDKYDRLISVLKYSDLQKHLGSFLDDAIQLGFLVEYAPCPELSKSLWQFTHLNLQEFFIAAYLAHIDEHDVKVFTNRCNEIWKVENNEMILSFLCGLDPETANQIITKVVLRVHDKDGRLFKVLRKLVLHFRKETKVDFPVPSVVDVSSFKKDSDTILFRSDNNWKHRNLHTLTVTDVTNEIYRNNLEYIKTLVINDNQSPVADSSAMLQRTAWKMREISAIRINSESTGFSLLLNEIPHSKVSYIALDKLQSFSKLELDRFDNLKKLHINDPDVPPDILNKLCQSVHKIKNLKQLSIQSEHLPESVLQFEQWVEINLKVMKADETKINKFTQGLKMKTSSPTINNLDLSGNNLSEAGRSIGKLLVYLPKLIKLDLSRCGMTRVSLRDMAEVIMQKNPLLDVREFAMAENDLQYGGFYIRKILEATRQVCSLNLGNTNFADNDMVEVGCATRSTKLCNICINTDKILDGNLSTIFELCKCFNILVISQCGISSQGWNDITRCMSGFNMSSLKVLAVRNINLSERRLTELTEYLPDTLEALAVASCSLSDIDELLYLLSKLPENVTHLDASGNEYGDRILDITQKADNLEQLWKLNIGAVTANNEDQAESSESEYLEALQDELQKMCPELRVYCDLHEDMWKMYS